MTGEVNLPTVVDGIDPSSGTPFDAAFRDGCETAINAKVRSATNPSISPVTIIDEVKAARGNLASLDARISNVVNPDGVGISLVEPSSLRNGFVLGNLLANETFMMWSRGDSAAPDYWALSGAGATLTRCGVGQADTNVLTGMDHFSAKLLYGSEPAILSQVPISATALARSAALFLKYKPVDVNGASKPGYSTYDEIPRMYLIGHVRCAGTSVAKLNLVVGGSAKESNYHPGDGQWHSLTAGPSYLTGSTTEIRVQCNAFGPGSPAYFQGLSLIFTSGEITPMYIPAPTRLVAYQFNPVIATPAAATGYGYLRPARPFHALAFAAEVLGAVPTGGTTLKLDLMTPVGGTFVSLFAALPAFVASDRHLFKELDTAAANYRRRTIRGSYAAGGAANLADNSVLRLDVNTRDSGNTATNILCTVIGLEYDVPFNQFRTGADLLEA